MSLHGLAARRLGAATLAAGAALGVAAAAGATWPVAVSAAWDAAAVVFLAWVWASVQGMDAASTAARARSEDVSRATADAIVLGASVASLVAVALVLVEAGKHSGGAKAGLIGLAIATVALAWSTVHTVYTLRYGHLYYEEPVGGINFHDPDPPDFRDFFYVAVTIGMTSQVSDTDLTNRRIRRTAVRHALLSYVFGAAIVAITINIVASLLNG